MLEDPERPEDNRLQPGLFDGKKAPVASVQPNP